MRSNLLLSLTLNTSHLDRIIENFNRNVGEDNLTYEMKHNTIGPNAYVVIIITLQDRSEIADVLKVYEKAVHLHKLSRILELDIVINKETQLGTSVNNINYKLEQVAIDPSEVDNCLKSWNWYKVIKPWETEDHLLSRMPIPLQKEAFISILTNLTYDDVSQILTYNEFNCDENFNFLGLSHDIFSSGGEYFDFMNYTIEMMETDKTAVRGYLQARYDAGVHINSIFKEDTITDYNTLYPKGFEK